MTEHAFHYRRGDGLCLRGRLIAGTSPLLVFLHGFRSVHNGTKANALAAYAAQHRFGFLSFDLIGHGVSDGGFEQFRVSEAIHDAAGAIQAARRTGQAVVIIGSSMGGWIGLEIARRRLVDVAGLMLIAPAVYALQQILADMDAAKKRDLARKGYVEAEDRYAKGRRYRLTQAFFDDAAAQAPPAERLNIPCPVRIVHGAADECVPLAHAEALSANIPHGRLHVIEGGDHRLSAHMPELLAVLEDLLAEINSDRA